jgi:glycosyltransferase involved in cell wall biosynthesis
MKILLFSADYWPDPGGIAAHVYYLSRALAEAGADVTVLGGHLAPIPHPSGKPTGPGIFREITIQRKGPRLFRGLWFLLRSWQTLNRLASERWDVIHYHNFLPDGLLLGLLPWPKAKIRVMTNHSDILLKAIDRRKNPIIFRWTVRQVNGIIAPTPELRHKSDVIQHPGQVITYIASVIRNGHVASHLYLPGAISRFIHSFQPDIVQVEQEVYSFVAAQAALEVKASDRKLIVFGWKNLVLC